MWKIGGKPVTRRSSMRIPLHAVIAVIFLATLSFLYLIHNVSPPLQNVDPWIIRKLQMGDTPVPAWVYTWINARLPRDLTVKVWKFDSFEIALIYITNMSVLEEVSRNAWYVGGVDMYIIAPPPPNVEFPVKDAEIARKVNYLLKIHNPDMKYNGTGVTIAILDTGIDYLLPLFYKNCNTSTLNVKIIAMVSFVLNRTYIWSLRYFREGLNVSLRRLYSWEQDVYSTYGVYPFMDIVGHGTAVASVIVGQSCYYPGFSGVAPGAGLVVLKVFPDKPYTGLVEILDALHWLYENYARYNIRIVSMSLNVFSPAYGPYSNPVNIVLRALAEKGLIVLVASGNSGNFPGTLGSIGDVGGVYLVGAWDPIHWRIATFTSMPTVGQHPLDFLGVGYMVWSVVPNSSSIYLALKYYYPYLIISRKRGVVLLSGTSLATPAVAGVVADWYQYYVEHEHHIPSPRTLISLICSRGYITGRIPLIVKCGLVRAPR